jgi:glutamyl-tRNA synthetase
MTDTVRVRFAPSPTGPLHIGGVRTALYNYLFAKKYNGTFVLRIEDTDQTRYVNNAEKYIIDALQWCNIPFDEGPNKNEKFGPYRQSERKAIYKNYINQLINNRSAYYAFDTPIELDTYRKAAEENGATFIYNWSNRKNGIFQNSLLLSSDDVAQRINNGDNYVIRFNTPEDEILYMEDEIRGNIKIHTNTLDDKILFKSDGMPTYHLANIVDDHLMKITHVIRGEEWLPSMPLHILLYRAFNWNPPKFAHLPLILKPIGKGKLSKRDGDKLGFPVFPLAYTNSTNGVISRGYKEDGYFSDGFVNMLAFLGWNPGNEQEIFSLKELTQKFDLKKVSKSGAKFSPDKAKWFNQQYMQSTNNTTLTKLYLNILYKKGIQTDTNFVLSVVTLIKERAVFVQDFWELSEFFFIAPTSYDQKASNKNWSVTTNKLMTELINVLGGITEFSSSQVELQIKQWIGQKEIGFGKIMQPLRLAIVGKLAGPHMFDIITVIGKQETINRINTAIKKFMT